MFVWVAGQGLKGPPFKCKTSKFDSLSPGVLNPNHPPATKVEAVGVERIVGTGGVQQQSLKTEIGLVNIRILHNLIAMHRSWILSTFSLPPCLPRQVLGNIFSVGIGGEGLVKSLLNALKHPQWQLVLQSLSQEWIRLHKKDAFKEPDEGWIQFWGKPPLVQTPHTPPLLSSSCCAFPCWNTWAPHCWWTAQATPHCLTRVCFEFTRALFLFESTLLEEVKKVALALLRNIFSTLRVNSIHGHQHPLILTPAISLGIDGLDAKKGIL